MKSPPILRIVILSVTLLLSVTAFANAQTPSRRIRDSQILPYLLDNPNDNSLVKVRCVSRERQEVDRSRGIIRDHLLRPTLGDRVTIEIEGNCQNVKIRVEDDSQSPDFPVYNPYLDNYHPGFDDSWLTREGSGWYWLLHHP